MKASNMVIAYGMVLAPVYTACMESNRMELLAYERNMAQFSRSLNELARTITDLSRQQIGNRNCGSNATVAGCPIDLGKIDQMRADVQRICSSLNADHSPAHKLEKTDVLHEVQAIFNHLHRRLGDTRKLLNTCNTSHQRGKLLHSALDPLVEIQENLNILFGICNGYSYASPHRNTIIQVLLTEARSFSLAKALMAIQTLADPNATMGRQSPVSSAQRGEFSEETIAMGVMNNDPRTSSSSWSYNIRENVAKYESLYKNRAQIAIKLATKNPIHITSVFADLSHRLCGTEFCDETKENLGFIEKLCMDYAEDSQTLKEMKQEGSLTAKKLAQLLKATMPNAVVSGGAILERVEAVVVAAGKPGDGAMGYVKQQASQAAVNIAMKTGIVNEKQLNSITKHVNEGDPFSKRVQKVTRIIKQYHLEGMVNTMIATLEGFDIAFTILMGRAADFYIECGKDCDKILTIVHDLKGYNITSAQEKNKALLSYLARLKCAWENPEMAALVRPCASLRGNSFIEQSRDTDSEGYETASEGLNEEQEADLDTSQTSLPGANFVVRSPSPVRKPEEELGKGSIDVGDSIQISSPSFQEELEETADYNADFLNAIKDIEMQSK